MQRMLMEGDVARDRFVIPLKCPACGKSGEAHCWQEDGWIFMRGDTATRVTEVTPGFSRVKQKSYWGNDVNFVCDECGKLSAKEQPVKSKNNDLP
jgi:acetone carboxylase gamma subunit